MFLTLLRGFCQFFRRQNCHYYANSQIREKCLFYFGLTISALIQSYIPLSWILKKVQIWPTLLYSRVAKATIQKSRLYCWIAVKILWPKSRFSILGGSNGDCWFIKNDQSCFHLWKYSLLFWIPKKSTHPTVNTVYERYFCISIRAVLVDNTVFNSLFFSMTRSLYLTRLSSVIASEVGEDSSSATFISMASWASAIFRGWYLNKNCKYYSTSIENVVSIFLCWSMKIISRTLSWPK